MSYSDEKPGVKMVSFRARFPFLNITLQGKGVIGDLVQLATGREQNHYFSEQIWPLHWKDWLHQVPFTGPAVARISSVKVPLLASEREYSSSVLGLNQQRPLPFPSEAIWSTGRVQLPLPGPGVVWSLCLSCCAQAGVSPGWLLPFSLPRMKDLLFVVHTFLLGFLNISEPLLLPPWRPAAPPLWAAKWSGAAAGASGTSGPFFHP